MNVSLGENGLVHSHSRHEFWMQNNMNDEETFEVEYKHHLQKWNGSAYVDIVPETQDDKPQVREERQQMGQNWSNQRGLDVDGQVGDEFKLRFYTAIKPPPGGGRHRIVAETTREFTIT